MSSQHVIEVSEATFQAKVLDRSRQTPVLVDFWAPWCGPCRMLTPVLEKLAAEYGGGFVLAKVNTDENQRLAMQYDIQGIPAVKAFRNGQLAAEFVGAQPEPRVREFLARLGAQPGAPAGPDADALIAQGRYAEAEAVLRAAGGAQDAQLALARALLLQGKAAEADQLLAAITEGPELPAAQAIRPLTALLTAGPGRDDAGEPDKLYARAGRGLASGDVQGSLDALLELLRRDRSFRDGEARRAMLAVFALLGDDSPLTQQYRARLAALLF